MAGAVAFDIVERTEDGLGIGHFVDLTPGLTVGRRHGGRIKTKIEERRANRASSDIGQLLVDARLAATIETGHERAIEENEIGHGTLSVHRRLLGRKGALRDGSRKE